jgi:hypothetical protein
MTIVQSRGGNASPTGELPVVAPGAPRHQLGDRPGVEVHALLLAPHSTRRAPARAAAAAPSVLARLRGETR